MFWKDQTIPQVQEQFFGIAHGFLGECLRGADSSGIPHTSLELFAPLGVVSACFNRYWASERNTERRSKALIGCIREMPETWRRKNSEFMQARGANPGLADRAEQTRLEGSLLSGFQDYNNAIGTDDAWINSHLRQGKKPTIPFRHTAQVLAKNYFKDDRFWPDSSSAWVSLGLPISLLFERIISIKG